MEARGKNFGFGFPGYDGYLPKAMRSSRGRGEGPRKSNDLPKDLCFFELLATVAGQLLQDADKGDGQTGSSPADYELVKSVAGNVVERGAVGKENHALSENQLHSFHDELHKGGARIVKTVSKTGRESSEVNTIHGEFVNEKNCEPQAAESCLGEVVPERMLKHEPSTTSYLGNSDAFVAHGHDSEASFMTYKSIRTSSSKREKDWEDVSNEHSLPAAFPKSVEDVASNEMKVGKLEITSRKCSSETEGMGNQEEAIMSELDQLTASMQADTASNKLGCGFIDFQGMGEGKGESGELDHGRYQRLTKREEDVDLILQDGLILNDDNPPLVSSGSSGEAPLFTKRKPCDMYTGIRMERRIGGRQELSCSKARDDDDNSSESTVPKTSLTKSLRLSYRKASKTRRLANGAAKNRAPGPGSKRKHLEMEGAENGKNGSFHGSGTGCTRQRTTKWTSSKKKTAEGSTSPVPDLLINTKNVLSSDSADKDGEPPASAAKLRRAKAASVASSPTSAASPSSKLSSQKSGEPHVKLSIKSFTVPELFVDLPESATVSNLKRAVMEAAMNLLGGGLRVRVLLQGKKVPDESASLLQVGISGGGELDSLGFMLEPSPMPNSPTSVEDPLLVLSHAASQPASRYPVLSKSSEVQKSSNKGHAGKVDGMMDTDATNSTAIQMQADIVNLGKGDSDLLLDNSNGELVPGSRALILHPSLGGDGLQGLALVPLRQKPRNMEIGKRRMRRPFSVAEVEALVHAVEKLGTGRWRDVKLQAFEQAKHRTYVDLKDKWKTLVHTARIAPHQRRGEPVPQEVLDRVIRAHSYWTAHQAKQQADLSLETSFL